MFGWLGDDTLGRERKMSLENADVSTQNITVKAGVHSGIAQIMVLSATRRGTQTSMPFADDVDKFLSTIGETCDAYRGKYVIDRREC